jgi:Ca2+-binding EF-hand superfamily protein
VAEQFGASQAQAAQDFTAIDANGSPMVSNAALLSALANTKNGTDPQAQALLSLMDTSKDGSVSGSEYLTFETALVSAET